MLLLKCCTQFVSKFAKLSSGPTTGESQFSFQSQRRETPKNVQTTVQLSSFHMLARLCSKSFKVGFSSLWTQNFQVLKLVLEVRGTRDQIAHIHWIIEKAREFQKNIIFSFVDYTKAFDCVDHSKLWKILKEMGLPDHLTCLLRNLYAGQEATVRTEHGTTDWFQIRKGVVKAVNCDPANLTYMQGASWEMPGWMKHKLESRFPGEYQ